VEHWESAILPTRLPLEDPNEHGAYKMRAAWSQEGCKGLAYLGYLRFVEVVIGVAWPHLA
jgi:hypothetical protein